jgi:hypothetical protein
LHISKVRHLFHELLDRSVAVLSTACSEAFSHCGIGLGGIVSNLLSRILLICHLAVESQNLDKFVSFCTEKKGVFWRVFNEGFQVVAYFQFDLCLLAEGEFQESGSHSFQPNAAHQEIVGYLAGEGPEASLHFQESLEQHFFSSGDTQAVQDVCRHVLVIACDAAEDAQDKLRDFIAAVERVVGEGQD